jgi:hypothetical protein
MALDWSLLLEGGKRRRRGAGRGSWRRAGLEQMKGRGARKEKGG